MPTARSGGGFLAPFCCAGVRGLSYQGLKTRFYHGRKGRMGRKGKQGSSTGNNVREYKIERKGEDPFVIRVGDTVLLRPPVDNVPEYVARVEGITVERNDVKVRTRWYYRPEESLGGRRNFHGEKEVFLSDHFDICSVDAIIGPCTVHSFKNYVKLDSVEAEDFFCRFEYRASTGTFKPDYVAVYCICEMPYNPDDLMVQCDSCKDWFHPKCINISADVAKELNGYICAPCKKEGKPDTDEGQGDGEIEEDKEQIRRESASGGTTPAKDASKVERKPTKRLKR